MMSQHYDVIVIGVGSMGAATCYYLAKKGKRVLGLEQFEIPHENGSHAGQSRIIRKAYFEHPDYVPLLEKAYRNWADIEKVAQTRLFHRTGLLYAGDPTSPLLTGTRASARRYNIPLEEIPATARKRFPQFNVHADFDMIFEPDAGFLLPERAVLTFAQLALQAGARLYTRQRILRWSLEANKVVVETATEKFSSDKLVITAGAWAGELLPDWKSKLNVTRQVVAWFQPHDWHTFSLGRMPCWLLAPPELPGAFYGFPILPAQEMGGPLGLKVAYHYPGNTTHPDHVDRTHTHAEEQQLAAAVDQFLPGGRLQTLSIKTCLYTNTPDEHFIIDFVPHTNQRVVMAAGFSGHGFKFAAGLGETLADLAIHEGTDEPIDFLSLARFRIPLE
jgi:sarcosine oxidase